jgi:hypothetical protein
VLQLVARLRERTCERVGRVAGHPAEDLRRRGDRAERGDGLRGRAEPLGGAVGRQVAGGGRQKQRADKAPAKKSAARRKAS